MFSGGEKNFGGRYPRGLIIENAISALPLLIVWKMSVPTEHFIVEIIFENNIYKPL